MDGVGKLNRNSDWTIVMANYVYVCTQYVFLLNISENFLRILTYHCHREYVEKTWGPHYIHKCTIVHYNLFTSLCYLHFNVGRKKQSEWEASHGIFELLSEFLPERNIFFRFLLLKMSGLEFALGFDEFVTQHTNYKVGRYYKLEICHLLFAIKSIWSSVRKFQKFLFGLLCFKKKKKV